MDFRGLCVRWALTDTFESTETEDTLDDDYFGTNDERLKRQQEVPITAIIGNPPYSVGQTSENDDNKNLKYPKLDIAIAETYVKYSTAKAKKSLYDTYIKSFRWASDRLRTNGIISFVTNGAYIDNNAMSGFRKSLFEEFNHLYIFNLRGDARTQGEKRRKESGNVFGGGSRTPIAISILVKDGSDKHEVHYHDIGDYLTRDDKLSILRDKESILNIDWQTIFPDKNNDWINQRDENYQTYSSMNTDIFTTSAPGVLTARDFWTINFSQKNAFSNADRMVRNYNYELNSKNSLQEINTSEDYIKWSSSLKDLFKRKQTLSISESDVIEVMYRPFTKKYMSYKKGLIHRPAKWDEKYTFNTEVIYTTGVGISKDFSVLLINRIPNFHFMDTGKGYILTPKQNQSFFEINSITESFSEKVGLKSNLFHYYVYGILHSKKFINRYANNLNKEIPRIPVVKDKDKYVKIGKKLADLHLNYENFPAYEGINTVFKSDRPSYIVKKMKHPKRGQLDTIIFNEDIVIKDIPERAYNYVVNGRPAIEWIIDQYQVKTDKKSGITDDPNNFSDDPKYILNLLLSVITVSMRTLELIDELPEFELLGKE